MAEDKRAVAIMQRAEQMSSARGNMFTMWQNLEPFLNTTRSFTTDNKQATELSVDDVFDNTVKEAAQTLSGALSGMLTNSSIKWVGLSTGDYELDQDDAVRTFVGEASNRILHLLGRPSVRFYTAVNELYHDLVDFGTGIIYAPRQPNIRFEALPLKDCLLGKGEHGVIDTMYYSFRYTAMEAFDAFGDNLPASIMKAKERGDHSTQFGFMQCVSPRKRRVRGSRKPSNKKFESVVISVEPPMVVQEGGFDEFPFITPRWRVMPNSVYGISQGMVVFDEIKMVNAAARSEILGLEILSSPPVQVPAEGFTSLDLGPNGVNFFQPGMEQLITPITTGANPQAAEKMLETRRDLIKKAFFNDLFSLPEIDRMTAQEVRIRNADRQVLLNPMIGRQQTELLDPAVQMAFAELQRKDQLPDIPPILDGVNLTTEYLSPLALNQRSSEIQGFQQYLATIAPLAEQDPSYLQGLHPDRLQKWLRGATNTPQIVFRTDEERNAIQQAEAEQNQQQAQMEQAVSVAGAAKDAASAADTLQLVG